MISIITPVYNAEKTLKRCADSILRQSYADWELLLVNDGSTDESAVICSQYELVDSRIRVFDKVNGGASSARNMGLDNARGEWIAFCDADDWVDENWLELFAAHLHDDGVQMVVQGFNDVGGNWHGADTGVDFCGVVKDGILRLAEMCVLGYLWTKIIRRDIVDTYRLRFDTRLIFREDEDFLLRYMQHMDGEICCMEQGAYNYAVPDFTKKYSSPNNFYSFLSIFSTLQAIYGRERNWLIDDYIKELTQSLFYSFEIGTSDRKQKLRLYKAEVGRHVMRVKNLSVVSKYLLAYVPSVTLVCRILDFKERLQHRVVGK